MSGRRTVGASGANAGRRASRSRTVAPLRPSPGRSTGHRYGQVDSRERLRAPGELVGRHEDFARRQQRARLVAAQQPVARFGILEEALRGGVRVAVQRDDRVGRQVVGERRGRLEEQRQAVLDAARVDAVRHVLVERRARRVALERLAEPRAEARAALVVLRELARGQQADLGDRIDGALRVGVERLDRLELVAEEVEPVRERRAHRVEVDQSAPDAEFARRHDLRHVRVAGERELRAQLVDVEPLSLLEEERAPREERGRRQPVHRGRHGGDDDARLALREPVERGQPRRDQVLVGRDRVVGQRLPVGKEVAVDARREPRDLVGETLRGERIGGQHRQRAAGARAIDGELRERERIGGSGERRERDALARVGDRRGEAGKRRERRRPDRGGVGGVHRGRGRTMAIGRWSAAPARARSDRLYVGVYRRPFGSPIRRGCRCRGSSPLTPPLPARGEREIRPAPRRGSPSSLTPGPASRSRIENPASARSCIRVCMRMHPASRSEQSRAVCRTA